MFKQMKQKVTGNHKTSDTTEPSDTHSPGKQAVLEPSMHLASASFRGLVTIQMLIRLWNSKLHILCGKESQHTKETRQAETKHRQKHKSLRQLAKQGSCRWLPGHQCDDAGDEDDAGVDGSGDGVLHHPVGVGWVVKGEENGIGDDAEHPEDDEADHQHKPLQPHLTTSTMQLITGGREGGWKMRPEGEGREAGSLHLENCCLEASVWKELVQADFT